MSARSRGIVVALGMSLLQAAAGRAQRPLPGPVVAGADSAAPGEAPIPVVAVGDGADFAAALTEAVRMAVESGAGLMLTSTVASSGERLTSDSIHTVSRGVVTRYALLDSARTGAGIHVRILAMVSRIRERPLGTASGEHVPVPGALWSAGNALDAERARQEAEIVDQLFGTIARQPSLYSYRVSAGPPVTDGDLARLRLRIIRTPNANYAAAMSRVAAVLGAVAGPSGDRLLHYPPRAAEVPMVRSCVSLCAANERVLLDPRAVLAPTDSFAGFDPPVVTAGAPERTPALFPSLPTAGGFAVAFVDRAARRVRYVHVRSTGAFFTVVDYLRTSVDEARFRLRMDGRAWSLREAFRAPWTGVPEPRLLTTDSAAAVRVGLVRGFSERTAGGPGATAVAGSHDVIIWVPVGDSVRADTAIVDVWLTQQNLAALNELAVEPLDTDRRLPPVQCTVQTALWTDGRTRSLTLCRQPAPLDEAWRPVGRGTPRDATGPL